jgi:hypothetical protein
MLPKWLELGTMFRPRTQTTFRRGSIRIAKRIALHQRIGRERNVSIALRKSTKYLDRASSITTCTERFGSPKWTILELFFGTFWQLSTNSAADFLRPTNDDGHFNSSLASSDQRSLLPE